MNNTIEYINISEICLVITDEKVYKNHSYNSLLIENYEELIKIAIFDQQGNQVYEEEKATVALKDGKTAEIQSYKPLYEEKNVTLQRKLNNLIFKFDEKIELHNWGDFLSKNKELEYEKKYKFRTTRFEDWVPETQIISTDEKSKTQNIRLYVFL